MAIGRTRARRTSAPPPRESEVVTLQTPSGATLAFELGEPRGRVRGTALLAHAMMGSRASFDRPRGGGLAKALRDRGLRTVALDFRGHGESGPGAAAGARWTYDDLVREDLPVLAAAVRDRWPGDPITLVGHSLGGHVALASAGLGLLDVDRLALLATNVWLPSLEGDPVLCAKKGAIVAATAAVTRARGYFPARALRIGSDDEALPYMEGWFSWWREDRWSSVDGAVDYAQIAGRVDVPILALASRGDRAECTPACALRFASFAPARHVSYALVERADDGGPAPAHMALVAGRSAAAAWQWIADFAVR